MIGHGPATLANRARNLLRDAERFERWAPARDACWRLLERHLHPGARVLVAGAGHGDDVPLGRLAASCSELILVDLDRHAIAGAMRRIAPTDRTRVRARRCELTCGAANRAARAALRGEFPAKVRRVDLGPVAGGGFDVVVGDLLYSQLLYPALADCRISAGRLRALLLSVGAELTDALVGRLHASASLHGCVVHLHDVAGWWEGHGQPHAIDAVLADGELLERCRRPLGADPRESLLRRSATVLAEDLWEWPFGPGTSYLVQATVAAP